jgi:hypothetical protein
VLLLFVCLMVLWVFHLPFCSLRDLRVSCGYIPLGNFFPLAVYDLGFGLRALGIGHWASGMGAGFSRLREIS